MTLKSDARFKEKLTCVFKYDMKNLVNFHTTTGRSENFFLMGSFSKVSKFWATKIQMSYLSWHWTGMQNLNKTRPCGFKNGVRNWVNICLKKCTLMGSSCPNHIMLQLENFMTQKCDAKLKEKLTRGLKNYIRNLVNFHASSQKSENFPFVGLLLFEVYKVLDKKLQKSYV